MIPVRKEYASYVQLESNRDAPQYLLIPTYCILLSSLVPISIFIPSTPKLIHNKQLI